MNKSRDITITRHQYIHILIGSMIGTGILSLPRTSAKIIGHDAWMAALFGAFLPILSILLIQLLYNKYPNMDFVDLSQRLIGKLLGKILVTIFIIYCAMTSAISCRLFLEAVRLFLLTKTPLAMTAILILVTAAYLAACDINIIGRINELIFYVLPICLLFMIPFVIIHGDILQILPVMSHKPAEYMEAALKTSFAFSGFEVSLLTYAYVNKKERILQAGIVSIVITALIFTYIIIAALVIFGAGLVQKFTFPTIRILSTAEIPVIERVEFLFLLLWITVAFKPICNQYFFTVHLIRRLFNLKSTKISVVLVFPIIMAITLFPQTIFDVFKWSEYAGWLSLFVGIAIPLILLAGSLFTGGGKKHEAE